MASAPDDDTTADLRRLVAALEAVNWRHVPQVSAATAAAFTTQIQAALPAPSADTPQPGDYECPDCGYIGRPADVERDTIVDGWIVTCADCGTDTVQPVAYAGARREEHRKEAFSE